MNCPSCSRKLIDVATSCRCGWAATGVDARPVCDRCRGEARMAIRTDAGWQKVCETHYVDHANQEAAKGIEHRGLKRRPDESSQQYRERLSRWMREKAATISNRMRAA